MTVVIGSLVLFISSDNQPVDDVAVDDIDQAEIDAAEDFKTNLDL